MRDVRKAQQNEGEMQTCFYNDEPHSWGSVTRRKQEYGINWLYVEWDDEQFDGWYAEQQVTFIS